MADEQKVTSSERLWSEECDAFDDEPEEVIAYIWSNDRKFKDRDNPYADPA